MCDPDGGPRIKNNGDKPRKRDESTDLNNKGQRNKEKKQTKKKTSKKPSKKK
jgi:hypothetical protein